MNLFSSIPLDAIWGAGAFGVVLGIIGTVYFISKWLDDDWDDGLKYIGLVTAVIVILCLFVKLFKFVWYLGE